MSDGQPLPVDLDQAERHLRFLDPDNARHTYQTAPDVDGAERRIYVGPLRAVAERLIRANDNGAGVYVMVNEGDLRGRKRENIRRIRFVFVDLDGAPLPDPDEHQAHGIVWSSPGKAHLYWRVTDLPIELFRPVQLGLAATFDGDPSVCDPPRVLRLGGFLHRKREPFRVFPWILDHAAPPLTLAELRERWPRVDAELRKVEEARRRPASPPRRPSRGHADTWPGRFLEVFGRKAAAIGQTGRHDLLVWGARSCLDNGLTEAGARAVMLDARGALPPRDGRPVPDAEVLEVVAWVFANLTPGEPWASPESPQTSACPQDDMRASAAFPTARVNPRKLATSMPSPDEHRRAQAAMRGADA